MEPIIPLLVISAIAAVGAISYYFNNETKTRRELKKQKGKRIIDFNHAEVGKIVGRVKKIDQVLEAPLSGRPCVFYQVIVEKKVKSGKSSSWKKIIHDQNAVNFIIQDDTHEAIVELGHVQVSLVKDVNLKSNSWSPPNQTLVNYLKKHNIDHTSLFGVQRSLRYKEGVLHIGETAAVNGTGFWELKPDPAEQLLIIKGKPDVELYISDHKNTLG